MKNKLKHDGFTIQKFRAYTNTAFSPGFGISVRSLFAVLLLVLTVSLTIHAENSFLTVTAPTLGLVAPAFARSRPAPASVARDQLNAFRSDMPGCVVTPGYLRDDVALSGTTTSTIQWTLTQVANNTPINTAQRLKNNDAFLACDIGVFWGFTPTTGGAESATQQNQMILHSFPESAVAQAADLLPLQQLYNGFVSIKEGSTTYYEQLEVYSFYRVDEVQQGIIIATGGNTANRSSWKTLKYGMMPVTPQFRMAGNRTYATNLNMNSAATFGALSGTNGKLYATIRINGFLATGGANYVKNR